MPSSTATWHGYLLASWTERLSAPDPRACTIVAELDGEVVGLAHTRLGDDAAWGALLDNLHVSYGLKRMGVGTRLMALTAQAVLDSVARIGPLPVGARAERRRPRLLHRPRRHLRRELR